MRCTIIGMVCGSLHSCSFVAVVHFRYWKCKPCDVLYEFTNQSPRVRMECA
jgi:hypothetical protein